MTEFKEIWKKFRQQMSKRYHELEEDECISYSEYIEQYELSEDICEEFYEYLQNLTKHNWNFTKDSSSPS